MNDQLVVDQQAVVDVFDSIAHDLLQVARAGGEKFDRIYLTDAADAIFHQLKFSRPVETGDIPHIFAQIKKHLRAHYVRGRGRYIYV